MPASVRYPIYCDYKEMLLGKKFVAGIEVRARVLAEPESDGLWIYGVTPGAIAESGVDLHAAIRAFRRRLKLALIDMVNESKDFESFRAQVVTFFNDVDETTEAEWDEARQRVRSSKLEFSGLHKERTNKRHGVRVVQLKLHPDQNLDDGADPSLAA